MHTSDRSQEARIRKVDLRRIQTAKSTIRELAVKYHVHTEFGFGPGTVADGGANACGIIESYIKGNIK